MDRAIFGKYRAFWVSGIEWPTLLATAGQETRKLLGLSWGALDTRIDFHMVDANRLTIVAMAA